MSEYSAPLDDMRFVLENVVDLAGLAALPGYEHADPETVFGVLEEAGRFFARECGPLTRGGTTQHGRRNRDGSVTTPEGFARAYRRYVDAGWAGVPFPPEYGGGGFPWLVATAMQEMLTSANMAFSLCPLLTQGAIDMLLHYGSEEQRETYLPKMVTGEWSGTMNLTEPQAGSDVGALTTKAVPVDDGSWRITGQKIFITYGEHDLADNIVHLVLARVPDAPPGTRGISCFIVPKILVNDDGSPGERNHLECVSLEQKMGINASPTCVMAYDGAVGYLIGEPNEGMRYMFKMMNNARLSVGVEGLSLGERAYQQAVAYAAERRQGRAPGAPAGESSPIIDHPDVRRMLLTMRAYIEALRCLAYLNAESLDLAKAHPDEAVRTKRQELADLLTPITKAWGTDLGVELTSLAGIAGTADELAGSGDDLAAIGKRLADAHATLKQTTDWLMAGLADPNIALAGATPYVRMCGMVTGGWLLARSAPAANRALANGNGDDEGFLRQKIVTARFYAEQLLPQAAGLAPAVQAGPADPLAAGFLSHDDPCVSRR